MKITELACMSSTASLKMVYDQGARSDSRQATCRVTNNSCENHRDNVARVCTSCLIPPEQNAGNVPCGGLLDAVGTMVGTSRILSQKRRVEVME
jgi:hypothetical protein